MEFSASTLYPRLRRGGLAFDTDMHVRISPESMQNNIYSKESTFRFMYIFLCFFLTLASSYFISEQLIKF